jgi:aquaporin rerated protein, invertebrate
MTLAPLGVSSAFIAFYCFLALIARKVIARTVSSDFVKSLIFEAIAAAELCSCCFELIIGSYLNVGLMVV